MSWGNLDIPSVIKTITTVITRCNHDYISNIFKLQGITTHEPFFLLVECCIWIPSTTSKETSFCLAVKKTRCPVDFRWNQSISSHVQHLHFPVNPNERWSHCCSHRKCGWEEANIWRVDNKKKNHQHHHHKQRTLSMTRNRWLSGNPSYNPRHNCHRAPQIHWLIPSGSNWIIQTPYIMYHVIFLITYTYTYNLYTSTYMYL